MAFETRASSRTPAYLLVLFLLWLAVYGSGIFRPALLDDADSVHAEAAREMLMRHDWVTLHANGIRYLEKAPLLYWMIGTSFRLFGVHDWSARLPLALGVLALLYSVYFLGRRLLCRACHWALVWTVHLYAIPDSGRSRWFVADIESGILFDHA